MQGLKLCMVSLFYVKLFYVVFVLWEVETTRADNAFTKHQNGYIIKTMETFGIVKDQSSHLVYLNMHKITNL